MEAPLTVSEAQHIPFGGLAVQRLRVFARRSELGFAGVRVALGAALFVRGFIFLQSPGLVTELVDQPEGWFWSTAAVHLICLAHIPGGLMLAAGLLTRLSAAVQLPILVGAIWLHANQAPPFLGTPDQSLELAVGVTWLLGVFTLFGGGPISLDAYATQDFDHLRAEAEVAGSHASAAPPVD